MINLLPPEQKKELLEEQKYRLTLILELLILLFLVSIVLILFSINLYISGWTKAQEILVDLAKAQYEESQIKDIEEKIDSTNETFSNLNSFYQRQANLTNLLEKISKNIPSEIDLKALWLTRLPPAEKEKYAFQVSLSGSAPTRGILYQLKKNLEAEENFKEIYLAISSWIEPTDFNLIFKVH